MLPGQSRRSHDCESNEFQSFRMIFRNVRAGKFQEVSSLWNVNQTVSLSDDERNSFQSVQVMAYSVANTRILQGPNKLPGHWKANWKNREGGRPEMRVGRFPNLLDALHR